jgi:pyruvyltransferase
MKPLKVFWSRGPGRAGGPCNAGDWFSPLICERLSGRPVVYTPPNQCDLVATGSLLKRLNCSHRLHRLGFKRRLHIWGTGSLRPEDRLEGPHFVHAVRGTLTRDRVRDAPSDVAMCDPGLLAQHLVAPPPTRRHTLGVIPHLVDRDHPEVRAFLAQHPQAVLLDIAAPVPDLLAAIGTCERVLSSSLHGLIFADAYDVPNDWFTASGGLIGGRHKFDDYYSVFDLKREPVRLQDVDPETVGADYARPGIEDVKRGLIASFPCM